MKKLVACLALWVQTWTLDVKVAVLKMILSALDLQFRLCDRIVDICEEGMHENARNRP